MTTQAPLSSFYFFKTGSFFKAGSMSYKTLKLGLTLLLACTWANAQAEVMIPTAPVIAAKGYILMDAHTGKVLIEQSADEKLDPASLTKIMTDYVIANALSEGKIKLIDQVPISAKAWKTGGSKMFVKVNSMVSVDELMHGIVIQSGNDASVAMAEYIAGSEEAFADLMNLHAKKIGMTHTHFSNSTGLPIENHYTTARDLALLSKQLIHQFPQNYKLYSQKEFLYNNIKQPHRNLLLYRDPSVDGIKTGYTEEAGYCLVASSEQNTMRLISVVMGTKSPEARATESLKLLTYGFRFYETFDAYPPGQPITQAAVWHAAQKTINLGAKESAWITLPRGMKDQVKADFKINAEIKAPIKPGQVFGSLSIKLGTEELKVVDLVSLEEIPSGPVLTQAWHWLYLSVQKWLN